MAAGTPAMAFQQATDHCDTAALRPPSAAQLLVQIRGNARPKGTDSGLVRWNQPLAGGLDKLCLGRVEEELRSLDRI